MSEHDAHKELDELKTLINWKSIGQHIPEIYSKTRGERVWPPLMMFKILLLHSWYNLSDLATEKQLARYLLFRRFIDLSLSESVPDHSSIWRFRNGLQKQGLYEALLAEINNQLVQRGLMIRSVELSIIDASVIQAYYQLLTSKKISNKVLARAYRNKALTEQQKEHNRYVSQIRSVIERTFSVLKKYYGLGQARYLGIARNSARVWMMCMAHNIKRAVGIHSGFMNA